LISFTGLIPSPFDVDAVLEITQNTMIESGNSEDEIAATTRFIEQFFYLFTLFGFVMYGLIGAIVGAIGANLNKHGSTEAVQ
jgi:sulfite exporter TauE/SafE